MVEEHQPETVERFDAAAFFDVVRAELFGRSMSQSQVEGTIRTGSACLQWELDPLLQQAAYVLASVFHETAQTMQPIEEYYGSTKHYAPWYGRGPIMITWEENYLKQEKKLGQMPYVLENGIPYKVHQDKNLALNPETGTIIAVLGCKDGDFTGKCLDDYINARKIDYRNARRVVNGIDKMDLIAGYAKTFEKALRAGAGEELPRLTVGVNYNPRCVDVGECQRMLNAIDDEYALDPDCVFGPATEDAVQDFQSAMRLVDDGICGPDTWAALDVEVRNGQ